MKIGCHSRLQLWVLLIFNINQLIAIDFYWLLLMLLIIDFDWMVSSDIYVCFSSPAILQLLWNKLQGDIIHGFPYCNVGLEMSRYFLVTSYITDTILLNSIQVDSEHEWSVKKTHVFNKSFTFIIITRNNQRRGRCKVFQVSYQRSKCSGSNAGVCIQFTW